jgi:hypothetical protein
MAIEHASASKGEGIASEPKPRRYSLICPLGTQGVCALVAALFR